jgi:hypothetical protein
MIIGSDNDMWHVIIIIKNSCCTCQQWRSSTITPPYTTDVASTLLLKVYKGTTIPVDATNLYRLTNDATAD